jgi:hypothetical protein
MIYIEFNKINKTFFVDYWFKQILSISRFDISLYQHSELNYDSLYCIFTIQL